MKKLRLMVFLLVTIAVLALSGCFLFGRGPLEIVSITPDLQANDVPIDAALSMEMSAELDATTVSVDTVQLLKGTQPEDVSVDVSGQTISLTPAELLDYGTDYTLTVAGSVADDRGNTLEGEVSLDFTTRFITVSVVSTGGIALPGAAVTVDGSPSGTTDDAGRLNLTTPPGGSITVAATKSFFQDSGEEIVSLEEITYTAEIQLAPYIYVPDTTGAGAPIPKIIRMASVDALPATFTSITSVNYGSGPSSYTLAGPSSVYVDYLNGEMYVTDALSQSDPITLIRMSDFPPAIDGSEATVSLLSGSTESVYWSQQIVVLDDGRVVLIDVDESELTYPDQFRIAVLPASLDIDTAQFSTAFGGGPDTYTPMGLVQLPSGELLISTGSRLIGGSDTGLYTVDDYQDDILTDFVTEATVSYGSGDNQFIVPFTMAVSREGDHVYVSDTGADSSHHNGRLVRYSTDGASGTAFSSYGSEGTGTGEFFNPVILGLLPDNKLYIMDVDNSRLVRIDPGVFDGGAADWTESDASATFTFDYWYNSC